MILNLIKMIIIEILYFYHSIIIIKTELGIGDWGLGIGDWAQSPIPNPQSPIPILRYLIKISFLKNI